MARSASFAIGAGLARAIWLRAQRLDEAEPFGEGSDAVRRAVAHLGYVQIDTINVVERCHHHILYSRIPTYRRSDLERAQSDNKSVFEYWTHALAYVPTDDYRFFARAMDGCREDPSRLFAAETEPGAYAALLRRIRREGPLSIRDFADEALVDKTHPWGSRKPSRAALRFGFFAGDLTVSKRDGMLKSYDLTNRHFGWTRRPRPATEARRADYLLDRALRSQGFISLESACYGEAKLKSAVAALVARRVRRRELVAIHIKGRENFKLWAPPPALDQAPARSETVHILSPFDPLVIQRKRLEAAFGYGHRFEAYVPAEKRALGYFALPVLVGDEIVAALDLKTDRKAGRLDIRKWTWIAPQRPDLASMIEDELARFERFQLA